MVDKLILRRRVATLESRIEVLEGHRTKWRRIAFRLGDELRGCGRGDVVDQILADADKSAEVTT